ncbi:MAG: L-threonylcarbamoyladenylate synthase, partial [Acidobacteria bacterium]|nr:L-threonylcarbamoyladenylate synthase [Acidobacteriota bacterium]
PPPGEGAWYHEPMVLRVEIHKDQIPPAQEAALERCLKEGGVAVFPTETFYGLGGDPCRPGLAARIAALKERSRDQALPLLAADGEVAAAAIHFLNKEDERQWRQLAAALWPGPLTLVARARPGLAPGVPAGDGSVGVRVPGLALARHLAQLCGGLLVATSANRSGEVAPVTAEAAVAGLAGPIDLLVDGGPTPGGHPSTVLRMGGGRPRLLREGAVSRSRISEVLGFPPAA